MGRRPRDRLQLRFPHMHGNSPWADSDSSSFRLDWGASSSSPACLCYVDGGRGKLMAAAVAKNAGPQSQPSRSRDNVRRKTWGLRGSAGGWRAQLTG